MYEGRRLQPKTRAIRRFQFHTIFISSLISPFQNVMQGRLNTAPPSQPLPHNNNKSNQTAIRQRTMRIHPIAFQDSLRELPRFFGFDV
jgi:hypothetical protein